MLLLRCLRVTQASDQASKLTDSLLSGFNSFAKELDTHVTPHLSVAAESISRSVSNFFAQGSAVVGAAGQAAAESSQRQQQQQSSTRKSLGGTGGPASAADAATAAGIWVPPPPPPPPPDGHVGVFDPSSTAAATPAPPPAYAAPSDVWSAEVVNEKV